LYCSLYRDETTPWWFTSLLRFSFYLKAKVAKENASQVYYMYISNANMIVDRSIVIKNEFAGIY